MITETKEELQNSINRLSVRLNNKFARMEHLDCEECNKRSKNVLCNDFFDKLQRIKRDYAEEWFAICEVVQKHDNLDYETSGTPYSCEISFQDKVRDVEDILDCFIPKEERSLDILQNQRNKLNRQISTLKKVEFEKMPLEDQRNFFEKGQEEYQKGLCSYKILKDLENDKVGDVVKLTEHSDKTKQLLITGTIEKI